MSSSPAASFRIGDLSSSTQCSVPTIRYYEQIGLIPRARRSSAKQRLYGADSVQRLLFIRRCREFGFAIERIRELVNLNQKRERDCVEVRDIAAVHLSSVREKLSELKKLELALCRIIAACNSTCAGNPAPDCTIFKDLERDHASPVSQSSCCPPAAGKSSRNK